MRTAFGEREVASLTAFLVFFALTLLVQMLSGAFIEHGGACGGGEVCFSGFFDSTLLIVTGIVISALLALIVFLTQTIHQNAERLAVKMTADIAASRDQFQTLYENSPVPYLQLDTQGLVVSPNKAALRFLGGTIDECNNINFFDLMNDEVQQNDFRALLLSKVHHSVPIHHTEILIQTLRRSKRWVLLSIFPLSTNTLSTKRLLVTLVDITEKKELEKTKAEFLSMTSHQLRTPLTAVKWYVDLLRTSKTIKVSDDVRIYLDKIYAGNQRMIDIVATLLNLSRLETGTLQVEIRNTDLQVIVQDVLDELEPQRLTKKIHLQVETDTLRTIGSDPNLVRICVQNILTNALRYTPTGGEVQVLGTCDANGCDVKVTDSGIGIPKGEQSRIFSKMFRATNARKIEAKGTGLGLYMTKAFIERLGGSIEYSSTEESGSTFMIHFPDHNKLSRTLAETGSVYYHRQHE